MIVVEIHTSHVIETYTPPANRLQLSSRSFFLLEELEQ